MYYDLNVPYSANHGELQRTLTFLAERQSFSDLNSFEQTLIHDSGLQQHCVGSYPLRTSSGKYYQPNTIASTVQRSSVPPSPSTLHSTSFRPFPKSPPQQYQLSIRHCSTPTDYREMPYVGLSSVRVRSHFPRSQYQIPVLLQAHNSCCRSTKGH